MTALCIGAWHKIINQLNTKLACVAKGKHIEEVQNQ